MGVDTTRKVQIHCIKPNAATLVREMAADATAAVAMKVVLVRYRFDIAGITAVGENSGKWMNYDPTITSTNANAASTGSTTAGSTTAGSTTAGASSGGATAGTTVASATTRNDPRTLAHFSLLALIVAMTGIAFL